MVAGVVDLRADHPPTVHHHLPLKAAILLHRQAIDLIHLQEKVPRAALVAPASGDLEVVAQEALDSADQVDLEAQASALLASVVVLVVREVVAPEVLASADQVDLEAQASVVVLVAQVVREVVAPEVLASVVAQA